MNISERPVSDVTFSNDPDAHALDPRELNPGSDGLGGFNFGGAHFAIRNSEQAMYDEAPVTPIELTEQDQDLREAA